MKMSLKIGLFALALSALFLPSRAFAGIAFNPFSPKPAASGSAAPARYNNSVVAPAVNQPADTVTNPGTIVVSVSGPTSAVSETAPNATATFTVSLNQASGSNVTVNYVTSNGTAIAGRDYQTAVGSVTIPAGSTSTTIAVPVLAGPPAAFPGETRTFSLTISSPTGGAQLGTATASATLTPGTADNSARAPTFSVASQTVSIAVGASPMTITVPITLSPPSASDVSVGYNTTDGTAHSGTDYTLIGGAGRAQFSPGTVSSSAIQIVIFPSGAAGSKTFTVTLSAPVGGKLGNSTATITIMTTASSGGHTGH